MLIAQWNILNRASDGWEAKGAILAGTLVLDFLPRLKAGEEVNRKNNARTTGHVGIACRY